MKNEFKDKTNVVVNNFLHINETKKEHLIFETILLPPNNLFIYFRDHGTILKVEGPRILKKCCPPWLGERPRKFFNIDCL